MKKLLAGILLLALSVPGWSQTYFTIFGPAAGIQKNTGATPFNTAAAATDVYGLFGCSGSSSSYLNGAGGCTTPAGTGVSSVTVPAPLTATGCTGGACTITWATGQTANEVLASPNGTTGAVSLRALVGADIPPINLASTANGGVSSSSILLGTNGGTSNGFFSVTGPTTSLKTFTFPNASATVLTTNAAVTVAQGGTGLATLTTHGVLLGEGTSNIGSVAAMAADTLLQGQGTSADPAAVSINNCGSTTQALSYSTSTHTFGCQTISTSGSPGGSNTQIQYNNSSAFGGASNFTYTSSTGDVAITQPTSGVALTIHGIGTTAGGLIVNNQSSVPSDCTGFETCIAANTTAGSSNGLIIVAGGNSSDVSLNITNAAQTQTWLQLFGDGGVVLNNAGGGDESAGTINVSAGYYYNGAKMYRTIGWQGTCTSGGCTTVATNGISSVSRVGTGGYTVTYSNAFNAAPSCVAGGYPGTPTIGSASSIGTSTVTINTFNTAGTAVDVGFSILCAGL